MLRVSIPGTALVTSRVGFGTASLHHAIHAADRQALLRTALDNGFTHFDTARMYGEGLAERSLGMFLAGGLRQRVTVASKFGIAASPLYERFPGLMYAQRALARIGRRVGWHIQGDRARSLSVAAAEVSLRRSLKALRTDWLDILFVHEPQAADIHALHHLTEWMLRQKASGWVRYLGLAGSADQCLAVHLALPGVFDVLQVEDSVEGREADVLATAGLPLQITFGYLRRANEWAEVSNSSVPDALSVMTSALSRNSNGMVLVSTRKIRNLRKLATSAGQEALV